MRFVITGFGAFRGVSDNPSAHMGCVVELLQRDGIECEFVLLEVSMAAVNEFYDAIKGELDVFVLHIGVNAGAGEMVVEKYGTNIANFGIPDARGEVRQGEPITREMAPYARMENGLDLAALVAGEPLKGRFGVSEDAGGYICNFAYFNGLRAVGKKIKGCLFVHIPLFRAIALEQQAENIVELVKAVEVAMRQ